MIDLYSLEHWGDGGEWCHVCQAAQPCAGIRAQFALLEGQIRAVVSLCEEYSGQSVRMLARDILTTLGRGEEPARVTDSADKE